MNCEELGIWKVNETFSDGCKQPYHDIIVRESEWKDYGLFY